MNGGDRDGRADPNLVHSDVLAWRVAPQAGKAGLVFALKAEACPGRKINPTLPAKPASQLRVE